MADNTEYKLPRTGGGVDAVLTVTAKSAAVSFPSPVTPNEGDAVKGLNGLALALGKNPTTIELPDQAGVSIPVPDHQSAKAFGAVMVGALASQGVVAPDAAEKVKTELLAPPVIQYAEEKTVASSGMDKARELLASLGNVLTPDAGHTTVTSKPLALPAVEVGPDKTYLG